MDKQQQSQLISAALAARQQAYAPYSKFLVGAAVLTEAGEIVTGTNVENASYGLTLCAERVAAAAAVAAGARKIIAVAISAENKVAPCGACRQFLAEFGGKMDVLMVDPKHPDQPRSNTLDALLPDQFEFKAP